MSKKKERKSKKITFLGRNRPKKKTLKKGDIVSQDIGYTIETKDRWGNKSTLWRGLPKTHKIKGKVVKIDRTFYQNHKNVNKLTMNRVSESPSGRKLRKKYILYQLRDGTLIR